MTPIMTMNFYDVDGKIDVQTEMHEKASGREFLTVIRTAVLGMIQTAIAAYPDIPEDDIYAAIFGASDGKDTEVGNGH